MAIDDIKIEELNSKNKKFTSNLKMFRENSKKNWLWINIGGIISITFITWILFFNDLTSLGFSILITLGYPLGIILRYNIKDIKHPIIFNKIALVGLGGLFITCILWLLTLIILFTAPWAPIDQNQIPHWLGYSIVAFNFVVIYSIVGYFLYRFGEKREWHISPYY
ncbi:MAG: hypothetical protein ACTSYI_08840 [Promethearchaeota archaeon]